MNVKESIYNYNYQKRSLSTVRLQTMINITMKYVYKSN